MSKLENPFENKTPVSLTKIYRFLQNDQNEFLVGMQRQSAKVLSPIAGFEYIKVHPGKVSLNYTGVYTCGLATKVLYDLLLEHWGEGAAMWPIVTSIMMGEMTPVFGNRFLEGAGNIGQNKVVTEHSFLRVLADDFEFYTMDPSYGQVAKIPNQILICRTLDEDKYYKFLETPKLLTGNDPYYQKSNFGRLFR